MFMNWLVGVILAIGVLACLASISTRLIFNPRGRGVSYLYMLTGLIGCFGIVIGILGDRGQSSNERPWHFLFDMKYQPKYVAQGESQFYPDGRAMHLPPSNTIPFDGSDFSADAGFHSVPRHDFLKADLRYYRGIADSAAKESREGVWVPKDPAWKGSDLIETFYVGRIPDHAIDIAGGWEGLFQRGKHQFNVYCAACHGTSGRGGIGIDAHGIMGAYGLSVAPADLTGNSLHSQPDGQLFNTIGNGKGQMSGYANQIAIQDRWAIVAHLRVLQYARK